MDYGLAFPTLASESCSWCHTLNPMDRETCQECGHDAHQPRMLCSCSTCEAGPGVITPTDIADLWVKAQTQGIITRLGKWTVSEDGTTLICGECTAHVDSSLVIAHLEEHDRAEAIARFGLWGV